MYHQQHHGHGASVSSVGAASGGGGSGLIVTQGETKNLSVPLSNVPSPPHTPLPPYSLTCSTR